MTTSSPVKSSKISAPHVPKYLLRQRLFDQIQQSGDRSAVWIDAPPGSGKTTLASSYLDYSKNSHIWYQVDSSDYDVASFFYWLGQATLYAAPKSKKNMPLFTPEYSFGIETFSRNFFDELYSRIKKPFVLVFDNYQLLPADSPVHDVMTLAIESLPPSGSILILSREKPTQQYARLLTNQNLTNINWNQIKLQADELEPLLKIVSNNKVDDALKKRLMESSDGWISGIILYLQSHNLDSNNKELQKSAAPEILFQYFTNEIMASQSDETNIFLQTVALLPQFSVAMATELTGNKNAEKIINNLLSKNYFINTLEDEEIRFEFHPLFRQHLLEQVQHNYSADNWRQTQLTAATILENDQKFGDMLELLIDAGDIPNAVRVLCEQSMALMMQGRHETIRQWIQLFPAEVSQQIPWLNFWRGVSLLAINPNESILVLEAVYPLFKQQKDVMGIYLTWCTIADAYAFAWNDFTPTDKWIEELDWLRHEYPDYPSPEIEVRVTFCAVSFFLWRQPFNPTFESWLQAAIAIQEHLPVNDLSIHGLNTVGHALTFLGRINEADKVFISLDKRIDTDNVSPTVFAFSSILKCVLGALGVSKYQDVDNIAEKAIQFSNNLGVRVFNTPLHGINIYFSVQANMPERARTLLEECKKTSTPERKNDYAHFQYLSGLTSLCESDYLAAEKAFTIAIDYTKKSGSPLPEISCHCGLALTCIELGKYDEAEQLLQDAYIKTSQISHVHLYYIEGARAYALLKENKLKQADNILQHILPHIRQHEIASCPTFYARCFAKLAARAYQINTETEFVDKIIKHFGITPYDDQDRVDNWPWSCRITLFGGYEIKLEDKIIGSGGKTAKKPKELLLALLTASHQTLSLNRAADLLWPDTEGDSASATLKMTIHRLRKLLDDERYISVNNGQIQLCASRLMCDAVEFDNAVAKLEKSNGKMQYELEKIITLYKGELADGCDDYYWLHSVRERYRSQYINAVIKLGALKHKDEKTDQAIEIYQKGLNVDSLAEDLYAGLMDCHLSMGNSSQGLKVYSQCRNSLESRLGVSPTDKTQKIAQQLNALASVRNRDTE